jgi:hypothetical protein
MQNYIKLSENEIKPVSKEVYEWSKKVYEVIDIQDILAVADGVDKLRLSLTDAIKGHSFVVLKNSTKEYLLDWLRFSGQRAYYYDEKEHKLLSIQANLNKQ